VPYGEGARPATPPGDNNPGATASGSLVGDCAANPFQEVCKQHEIDVGKTCEESINQGGDEVTDEMCKGRAGTLVSSCQQCIEANGGHPELCDACKNRKFGLLISDKVQQQQSVDDKVDILWVIDNSASMMDEQVKIAENFTQYIERLNEYRIDFHLAVVLTDINYQGDFISQVFTRDTPELIPKFQDVINRIRKEYLCAPEQEENILCYQEQGLNTAYLAMQKAVGNQAPNQNFLRPDAKLSIIVVSDDDEMTQGDNAKGPTGNRDMQVSYLMGLKPAGMIKISSFVADGSEECYLSNWQNGVFVETAHNIERVGDLYMQASRKTGGYIAAICDSDFISILDALGFDSIGLKHRFKLSDDPDPFSIVVKVDGIIIPRSRNNGWTYNEGTHEIEFHGSFIPQANAQISFTYYKKS